MSQPHSNFLLEDQEGGEVTELSITLSPAAEYLTWLTVRVFKTLFPLKHG